MRRRTSARQWILAAAGLAMLAAAGVLVWRSRVSERPVAKAAAPVSAAPPRLSVQRDGGVLRVHWDPQALRSAGRAALIIADGSRESRLNLDSRDVRAGAASYWPESRDVSFRLELDGAPVASVRAPAVVAESRPSPFTPPEPRKAPAPVKRARAQRPAGPLYVADPPKRHKSFVAKIPLLRRLSKHRD